jgi:hypothetical protein
MHEVIDALKSEISSHGMVPPDQLEPGNMARFSDDGGKNKNGWCILYINPDGSAGAAFGNWKNILLKIKKNSIAFLLPWIATIVTAVPYNDRASRFLDRLVCKAETDL